MYAYHLTVDDAQESTRLENICLDLGAVRYNQEGWTTAYGGNGISVWVEMPFKKSDFRQVVGCFNSVAIVSAKKVAK